ncbi:hypothetical protein B9Z55_006196 [Caenorhabditis nigoni]|uniref:Forkhead box protein pes-1 n=1 Tax=Caenorhabditis nigoni TaxID=1611254 RepID=A0A2G5V459_9PELO|nr:hypothetical protein B9Z55_006196 [Caenorhabditis nigoni]
MTELNSSLCQLNWLIAKGGIGDVNGPEMTLVPEKQPILEVAPAPPIAPGVRRKIYEGPDKPPYSYSQLIRFAIEDSVDKKCTLAEIYSYISQSFQFYRENRNPSWKNSIRHNLSLNKQFNRIEKTDGDRRGWWVCVEPPAKKPRILKGDPVRVNPIYEHLYNNKQQEVQEVIYSHVPEQVYMPQGHEEIVIQETELTEQEIMELNLFESYDLNSSFRDVYNQIFEKPKSPNEKKQAAQIDWLKISLEAAGLDYHDEQDLREIDTVKLKDYVYNGFPSECDSDASTPRTDFSRHSSSDSCVSNSLPVHGEESDDETDWDTLI